ncbi:MAG: TonB-dependent receptor [Polyangiaceae bacterium]
MPTAGRQQRRRESNASSSKNGLEVTVQGVRALPGAQSLSAAEAREIPATFGDPLRAVEVMPGVTPVMAGLPYFYVRGAPPGNVGYFVDGVRVPLLWHALVGPSVIHPATLDKVTLYRGAYPAAYGRYAGAIVTADTVAPTPEWRGEAGIRLIDSSLMVQAPIGRIGDGLPDATAMISGRYSYTGLAVSILSSKVDLGYWDYQTRVTVPITRRDELSVLGLGAYDSLSTAKSTSSVQYHRVDLRYDHRFADDHGGLRVAVTVGHDDTGGDRGTVQDNLVGARLQLERRLSDGVVLRTGVDGLADHFTLDVNQGVRYQTATTLEALLPTRREVTAGAYATVDLLPTPNVLVSPGVRADYFTTRGDRRVAVDPRLSTRMRLSPRVTVEHSIGFASQAAAVVPGVPAAQVMSLEGGLQRAIQASSGVNYQANAHTSLNLVLFDTIYQNLSDPLGTTHRFVYDIDEESQRVRGSAYGAEIFLHRRMHRRVSGFLSYTLSRSTRSHGTISTLSALDRTHVVNGAIALDVGRRWRLGARGTLLGGLPVREATTAGDLYHGERRTPPFVRLDLRAEKRWIVSARYWYSVVFELMNATLAEEITERSCNPVRCTEQRVGPIVMPSIGVEAHF